MTDRPILFSAPMVRALLDGRKTQTRRIMKVQPPKNEDFPGSYFGVGRKVADGVKWHSLNDYPRLPKHPTKWDLDGSVGVARIAGFPMEYDARFATGDRLWVRESGLLTPTNFGGLFRHDVPETLETGHYWSAKTRDKGASYNVRGCSRASAKSGRTKVTPSIHMPRWASRLTLIVTDVRIERLQDISEADAIAEGVSEPLVMDDSGAFYGGFEGGTYRCGFAGLWTHIHGPDAWDANPWVVAVTFRVERQNIDRIAA